MRKPEKAEAQKVIHGWLVKLTRTFCRRLKVKGIMIEKQNLKAKF